jgi:hypothetical protein
LTAVNRRRALLAHHCCLGHEGLPPWQARNLSMPEVDAASGVDARSVDAAITRVLQAERAAREEVQRCAEQAEAIVERAQESARQVARRAAHRSVRVQRWSAAALQDRLERLAEQQAGIEQAKAHAAAPGRLRRAVETLAAQLTGASR